MQKYLRNCIKLGEFLFNLYNDIVNRDLNHYKKAMESKKYKIKTLILSRITSIFKFKKDWCNPFTFILHSLLLRTVINTE